MDEGLFQLLGLVCISGLLGFVALLTAAVMRQWLEGLGRNPLDGAGDDE